MSLFRHKIKYLVLFPSILLGFVISCGLSGLAEGIYATFRSGYYRWTAPFSGMLYYGLWGAVLGCVIGGAFVLVLAVAGYEISRRRAFVISVGAGVTFCLAYSPYGSIISKLGVGPSMGIPGIILYSFIILGSFAVIYFIFQLLYSSVSKISGHPLAIIGISYLVIFLGVGIISAVIPAKPNVIEPYRSDEMSAAGKRPNILFILVDCLRHDWISPMGYDIKTEAIDMLADDGILFTNAIANSNWTMPAVGSIFTSLQPQYHGLMKFTSRMPDSYTLLADELGGVGYYTIGFSTNPNVSIASNFSKGFNEFYFLKGLPALPRDPDSPHLKLYSVIEKYASKALPFINRNRRAFRDAGATTDLVLSWFERNKHNPFFMYIHYMDPHYPYYRHPYDGTMAAPHLDGLIEKNRQLYAGLYKGEVEYADHHIMRLLNYLKKEGLYDSTLIILTSDHGEAFFDHYFYLHGISAFEEIIHTPLIVKLPGDENAGTRDSTLICQLDYAPTLLSFVGATPPESWEGHNFFDPDFNRNFVALQAINGMKDHRYRIRGIRTNEYKWVSADSGYTGEGIYTYQGASLDPRGVFPPNSLFDLVNDPAEMNNLYGLPDYRHVTDSIGAIDSLLLSDANARSPESDNIIHDQETLEQLKALGYLR
jgi:arylsulfatase A-like enzyme